MRVVEINWQVVKAYSDIGEVEEYMRKYWDYMDENRREDGDKSERVEIIKRLREIEGRHG